MHKKLSNQEWQDQIDEYYSKHSSTPINKFCEENNLSKQQFYYHKKKRVEALSTNNTVFQAVPVMANEELTKPVNDIEKIKISISNWAISAHNGPRANQEKKYKNKQTIGI